MSATGCGCGSCITCRGWPRTGKIELTILRDGEKKVVSTCRCRRDRDLLIPTLKDGYPEYFIYGPLVFTAATQEYVRALGGGRLAVLSGVGQPDAQAAVGPAGGAGRTIVVIATRMFPHPIIKGYDNRPLGVVEKLNGDKSEESAPLGRDAARQRRRIRPVRNVGPQRVDRLPTRRTGGGDRRDSHRRGYPLSGVGIAPGCVGEGWLGLFPAFRRHMYAPILLFTVALIVRFSTVSRPRSSRMSDMPGKTG